MTLQQLMKAKRQIQPAASIRTLWRRMKKTRMMTMTMTILRVAMINNHVDDYADNDEDNDIDGDDANLLSGGSCSGKRSLTEMTMTVTIMRLIMVIML